MDSEYGIFPKFIEFVKKLKGTFNNVDAKLVLSSFYDTTFGIFDHFNKTNNQIRPIASVALFEEEDYLGTSTFYEIGETYHDSKIKEYFGLTLMEFVSLPTVECKMLLEISAKIQKKDIKAVNASIDVLKSSEKI